MNTMGTVVIQMLKSCLTRHRPLYCSDLLTVALKPASE